MDAKTIIKKLHKVYKLTQLWAAKTRIMGQLPDGSDHLHQEAEHGQQSR
jgi:hypothetical protein